MSHFLAKILHFQYSICVVSMILICVYNFLSVIRTNWREFLLYSLPMRYLFSHQLFLWSYSQAIFIFFATKIDYVQYAETVFFSSFNAFSRFLSSFPHFFILVWIVLCMINSICLYNTQGLL